MRLLTRSDFDGLACAVLLKEVNAIDSYKFIRIRDLRNGAVEVGANDILANVPYMDGCGMWFDHHASEYGQLPNISYKGLVQDIDSAAHAIYNFYKGHGRDLSKYDEMLEAVDKVDSAKLSADDISRPRGWILLGFLLDPLTGLGRYRDFHISGDELMGMLTDACSSKNIAQILAIPDVAQRIDVYHKQNALFMDMLKNYTETQGNVIITDLRGKSPVYSGNRFLLYNLHPGQNISIWAVDANDGQGCEISVGYSIINKSNANDVGSVMSKYGGGGRRRTGACVVPFDDADRVISELKDILQ